MAPDNGSTRMKVVEMPLSPTDAMFTSAPMAYAPGSTKQLTPNDGTPEPVSRCA
jgi:hypothetical protein